MVRDSKFEATALRVMIVDGKSAQQIMDHFGINKVTLKAHVAKLMALDERFYKVVGMEQRATGNSLRFSKNGMHISPTLLQNYGFSVNQKFKLSSPENGKILLEVVSE